MKVNKKVKIGASVIALTSLVGLATKFIYDKYEKYQYYKRSAATKSDYDASLAQAVDKLTEEFSDTLKETDSVGSVNIEALVLSLMISAAESYDIKAYLEKKLKNIFDEQFNQIQIPTSIAQQVSAAIDTTVNDNLDDICNKVIDSMVNSYYIKYDLGKSIQNTLTAQITSNLSKSLKAICEDLELDFIKDNIAKGINSALSSNSTYNYVLSSSIKPSIENLILSAVKDISFSEAETETIHTEFKKQVKMAINKEQDDIVARMIEKAVANEIVGILGKDKEFWQEVQVETSRVRDEALTVFEYNKFVDECRNDKKVKRYAFLVKRAFPKHNYINVVVEHTNGKVIIKSGKIGTTLTATDVDMTFDVAINRRLSSGYVDMSKRSKEEILVSQFMNDLKVDD